MIVCKNLRARLKAGRPINNQANCYTWIQIILPMKMNGEKRFIFQNDLQKNAYSKLNPFLLYDITADFGYLGSIFVTTQACI